MQRRTRDDKLSCRKGYEEKAVTCQSKVQWGWGEEEETIKNETPVKEGRRINKYILCYFDYLFLIMLMFCTYKSTSIVAKLTMQHRARNKFSLFLG